MNATVLPPRLQPLGDEEGTLAMLALDQRESLRAMLAGVDEIQSVPDASLVDFKAEAGTVLTPHATAVLLDRLYALDEPGLQRAPECALILAADILHQPAGGPVVRTEFDEHVTVRVIEESAAAALKLLVMWRADEAEGERRAIVDPFLQRCADAGVAAVVEGIVVPPEGGFAAGERDAAVIAAAEELSVGADLYKAQVPGYAPGETQGVQAQAELLTSRLQVPWVVLSNGVQAEDFAEAVRQACLGGAHGFLAGRAIWADTVLDADRSASLRQRSVDRLDELRGIVKAARGHQGAAG
ncbi:aldolase [uncultured Serinicoccus sp.]|uniref:aldolase n=1 Tax=uncultured Serinicoccus sp. TaxID=735514 RepID=UPI00261E7881|nr:aldolase [uncultured Serinicoccus sp.]